MIQEFGGSLPRYGAIKAASWLGIWLAVNLSLVGPFAYWIGGWNTLAIAGVAGLVCYGGGIAAVLISTVFRGPDASLLRMATSMLFRTGAPLVFIVVVYLQGGRGAAEEIVLYLLAFYPIALLVETVLSLPRNDRGRSSAGVAKNG